MIFKGLPRYSFDLIMADPPWRFEVRSQKGITEKGAEGQYSCMTIEDIMNLPVKSLAKPDCVLWLWSTNPLLRQCLDTLDAWGFEFKTAGTWVKTTKHGKIGFGTGYILRSANEPFLIGTRGSPVVAKNVRSAFLGLAREHSRKPEEGYAAAEKMMPRGRRLELFARHIRPGWSAWGDELEKFKPE